MRDVIIFYKYDKCKLRYIYKLKIELISKSTFVSLAISVVGYTSLKENCKFTNEFPFFFN